MAATTLIGVAATGCSAAAHEEEKPATKAVAAIRWGNCPPLAAGATRDLRQQCATVEVPLNYQDPKGAKIGVEVSRISTAKKGQRHGVLVVNPGGPALPGLDQPGELAKTLPKSVLDRYDLIGFDPRGVGRSTPQSCGLEDPSVFELFPYPAADGSIDANVETARSTAQKCASSAKNLKYFTTANTARDLDLIRQGLGEKKISYWGQSYGTYLGAVYRSLFQKQTDRMILEGNVDPTDAWAQDEVGEWGKGFADRFADAAAVIAQQDATLGLGKTVPAVTRTYLELAARLDRKPAPMPGTRLSLNGGALRTLTYALLLHNETLPVIGQFTRAAADLADGHLTAADTAVLEQVSTNSPAAPGVPADNQPTMFLALACGDAAWTGDVEDYAAHTAADRKAYPLTAGMPGNIWACAYWTKPIEAPVEVDAKGSRNVLILQNKRDNATPWEGGAGLRRRLGSRSAFVGVDNGGHYVYHVGSKCADAATVTFLADGKLPGKDLYCTDVA